MKSTTKIIARAGLVSALYTLLSLITFPVASGAIQFRVSEALCV
ncbi:MAG: QueT transporter family protein, partial [Clostridia bacterium]|nr:QueT transporter family protein [Clostridia bacterium]